MVSREGGKDAMLDFIVNADFMKYLYLYLFSMLVVVSSQPYSSQLELLNSSMNHLMSRVCSYEYLHHINQVWVLGKRSIKFHLFLHERIWSRITATEIKNERTFSTILLSARALLHISNCERFILFLVSWNEVLRKKTRQSSVQQIDICTHY